MSPTTHPTPHTLVVIADRTGARSFLRERDGSLRLLEEIEHPDGKLHDRDHDSDRPGRTHDSFGVRHGLERHVGGEEHRAHELARRIAATLRGLRVAHRFDNLVLVAEPRFLGVLREALDDTTRQTVRKTVPHDLGHLSTPELEGRVRELF